MSSFTRGLSIDLGQKVCHSEEGGQVRYKNNDKGGVGQKTASFLSHLVVIKETFSENFIQILKFSLSYDLKPSFSGELGKFWT